jgi:hypothetical protein
VASSLDTSYRTWSVATLEAVRTSTLAQMKAIEGTGQSHSASGRNTTMAPYDKLLQTLTNVEAALDWKRTAANDGNKGFATRYSSFN